MIPVRSLFGGTDVRGSVLNMGYEFGKVVLTCLTRKGVPAVRSVNGTNGIQNVVVCYAVYR